MEITLYPTETIYGLGVDALDQKALRALFDLKGREEGKPVSWLVRNIADIEECAEVGEKAAEIAKRFLPGPLTLVLAAKPNIPDNVCSHDRTIGFRISSDPAAQKLAEEFGKPLTCTSANLAGEPTRESPEAILAQFGEKASLITRVINDGPRSGTASTVVRVTGEKVDILREGAISRDAIMKFLESQS